MSHAKRMKDSCHTFQCVMSHVSMSHVTRINKTRRTLWKKCYYWLNTESQQPWLKIYIYIYTYICIHVYIHTPVHVYQNHGHPSSAFRISPATPIHICTCAYTHKLEHTNVCLYIYIAETWLGDRRQLLWPYTRSMCMWCLINKRWVLFKHSELKWEGAPTKLSFFKELCSKSANCSLTFPKTGLSVTNSLVYGAVARRCAHELSHD